MTEVVVGVDDGSAGRERLGDVAVAAAMLGVAVDDLDNPDRVLLGIPPPIEDPTFRTVEERFDHHPPP
jgi:hypothetical protein